MGSTISSNISRVDVSNNGEEECVVYWTPDSRSCTLRASTAVNSACVTLRDYTFDREGTRVDIRVHYEGDDGGFSDVQVNQWGNYLQVRKIVDPGEFRVTYGVPRVRRGILMATKHKTNTQQGDTLFVAHSYSCDAEQRFSMVVAQVWYDRGKGRFMSKITGPSWHSSPLEAIAALIKADPSNSNAADSNHGLQITTMTGLINNKGGVISGDLNGSILNFYNFFMNK